MFSPPIALLAMDAFTQTLSLVGPFVLGIMVLATFFKILDRLGRRSPAGPTEIAFSGILDDGTRATVHLSNGTTFENARFIGFTNTDSIQGQFPFDLRPMVILELPDGRRVIVQAKLIRMIEIPPTEISVRRGE